MIDSALSTFFRLGMAVLATVIIFAVVGLQARELEARVVAGVVGSMFGSSVTSLTQGEILIAPVGKEPLVAIITTSCSSIAGVLTLGSLAVFVMRGSRSRRLIAFALGSSVWIILNTIRIAAAVVIAENWGRSAFGVFHNWVGTGIALIGAVTAFIVMVRASLPSDRQLREGWSG